MKRKCDYCGKVINGKRKKGFKSYFCNKPCKGKWMKIHPNRKSKFFTHKNGYGPNNSHWGGDSVTKDSGRLRAARLYSSQPCEVCGKIKTDRHHVDGNTLNNDRRNIRFLCRKHHMEADGRLKIFIDGNKNRPARAQSGYKWVYPDRTDGKWTAMIYVNGKMKYIGRFFTPEDANNAVEKAKKALHQ